MTTRVVFFPFDLFGGGGCAAGVDLMEEALAEILADQRRETATTRGEAFEGRVRRTRLALDNLDDVRRWRGNARRLARRALQSGEPLVWITGSHLGALPLYDELGGLAEPVLVIQLDAHLDVQNFAASNPEPTHGNFLLHCAGPLPPLVNLGHRDQLLPPTHWRRYFRQAFPAAALAEGLEHVRSLIASASRVWIDLDWDVVDPAFFPAVSRPVPFGLSPLDLLRVIDLIPRERLAGVILSEFDPGRDRQDQSLASAAWLLEHLLLKWHEG